MMSRVIAVVACGFTVAACSASMPSLNFLSSSPSTEALRFESEPPGAEVKTSSGQNCRTPCELSVQAAPELSATFTLNGYQPQTVSVRSEGGGTFSSARLAPNPVYVELKAAAATSKKRIKKKPAVARANNTPVASASAAPAAAAPVAAAAPEPAPASESAPSATNYPWPAPPTAR
jgi:hypothetical protein